MFSKEVVNFLIKVVSSWQIIVVTIVLFLFLKLVFFVAQPHSARSFNPLSSVKPKKEKKEKPAKKPAASSEIDELGLDEE